MAQMGGKGDRGQLVKALRRLQQMTEQFIGTPLPEWHYFARNVHLRHYSKGSEIPTQHNEISIVLVGGIKLIFATKELDGQVAEFYFPGSLHAPNVTPSLDARSTGPFPIVRYDSPRPKPETISIALERTLLLRFDYQVVERLSARYPQWGQIHSAVLWSYVEGLLANVQDLRAGDATTRYQRLMERRGMSDRISQRDIASYLGISRETLNRIIKKLEREGEQAAFDHEGTPEWDDELLSRFSEAPGDFRA